MNEWSRLVAQAQVRQHHSDRQCKSVRTRAAVVVVVVAAGMTEVVLARLVQHSKRVPQPNPCLVPGAPKMARKEARPETQKTYHCARLVKGVVVGPQPAGAEEERRQHPKADAHDH